MNAPDAASHSHYAEARGKCGHNQHNGASEHSGTRDNNGGCAYRSLHMPDNGSGIPVQDDDSGADNGSSTKVNATDDSEPHGDVRR